MRILVAAASHSSNISGLQRHALNVVRCLLLRPEISSVHLVVGPWQTAMTEVAMQNLDPRFAIHVAEMGKGALGRNHWYYKRLPELVAEIKPDLVHLTYPVPLDASAITCPTVLSLHDLYPYEIPRNFGFPKVFFNRFILQQCIRNVDAIACVSNTTVFRMQQYLPQSSWKKARRIYNCVDPHPYPSSISPLPGWRGEPFVLCVAQHRQNKNIPFLIRAFHRLLQQRSIYRGTKLVVIGISGPETRCIQELSEDLGLAQHIMLLEGLSDAQLQWCYLHCEALAAPSITEGFGLPVAEALLAGCRVVCSDIPAFHEISMTDCAFASCAGPQEDEFAAVMTQELRKAKPGPVSLRKFSSTQIASEYMQLYSELIASHVRRQAYRPKASASFNSAEGQAL